MDFEFRINLSNNNNKNKSILYFSSYMYNNLDREFR